MLIYKPLVSIIVASYGNAPYIDDMIQSVLNQTYTNWELIITDDASPDNSNEIIEKHIQKNYDKIKLLKHQINKGAGGAFKTCMDYAHGEIVAMLGADDALTEDAIKIIVEEHIYYEKASMIIGSITVCNNDLIPTKEIIEFPNISKDDTYLNYFGLSGWDTFKKKYYIKTDGFNISQKRAIDQDLYFKMEEVGELVSLAKNLYLYRTNPNGISQNNNQSIAHEYNYKAIINTYNRRKQSGYRNLEFNKYKQKLINYNALKFYNLLKQDKKQNLSIKEKTIANKIIGGEKIVSIKDLNILFSLVNKYDNSKFYDKKLVKQKLVQSFFIREKYNITVLKNLFNNKLRLYSYMSLKENIKIGIKCIIKHNIN